MDVEARPLDSCVSAADRRVRGRSAARCGRDGRGVSRARYAPGSRGGSQSAARRLGHRCPRRARFDREARVLAALNHPNIATLYGVEDSPTGPILVMELVEGTTLADRLALEDRFPLAEALAIARQVARPSRLRMNAASSIAISNRRTSSFARTARRRCSTSALPRPSRGPRTRPIRHSRR